MSFDLVTIGIAVVALLLGLWLGMALRGGAKRRAIILDDRLRLTSAERDTLLKERDGLRTELATSQSQIRPLSDELDKLRRQAARQRALDDGAVFDDARSATPLAAGAVDTQDVRRLKGVGDRFAAALAKVGITSIGQIAAWSRADADVIDGQLGDGFRGRVATDRLVEQAQLLHGGRVTEYETRFGKL